MKKILVLLMITSILGLTACSDSQESTVSTTEEASTNTNASRQAEGKEGMQRPNGNMDFDGEIVIPENLDEDLKAEILALPEQAQRMILSRIPEEITDDVEAQIKEMITKIGDGDMSERMNGENGNRAEGFDKDKFSGGGHHHDGLSKALFESTERIELGSNTNYKDGVYEGSADAYEENLVVSITIEDNAIVEITIIDHNETPDFYEEAFETIPELIKSNQSTNVDTVSGATASSQGIILAVENALEKAQ